MRPTARQRQMQECAAGRFHADSFTVYAVPSAYNPMEIRSADRLRHFHGDAKGHVSFWALMRHCGPVDKSPVPVGSRNCGLTPSSATAGIGRGGGSPYGG